MLRKLFEIGGFVTGGVLIVFGVAAILVGASSHRMVRSGLSSEHVVGTADMNPATMRAEATHNGLRDITVPTCSVAGVPITTGARARCFAMYMEIQALEVAGGKTYAQTSLYATADGKGTNTISQALYDSNGVAIDNPARQVWVNEIALSSALNLSYVSERLSLFSMLIGVALILSGIGFVVLDVAALHRRRGGRDPR